MTSVYYLPPALSMELKRTYEKSSKSWRLILSYIGYSPNVYRILEATNGPSEKLLCQGKLITLSLPSSVSALVDTSRDGTLMLSVRMTSSTKKPNAIPRQWKK